jgi:hypothetical protein
MNKILYYNVRGESDNLSVTVMVNVGHKLTKPSALSAVSEWRVFVPLSTLPGCYVTRWSLPCTLRCILCRFMWHGVHFLAPYDVSSAGLCPSFVPSEWLQLKIFVDVEESIRCRVCGNRKNRETEFSVRPPWFQHAVRPCVFRTFFSNICVARTVRSVGLFLGGEHCQLRTSGFRQEKCVSVGVSCATDTFRCRQFDTLFLSDPVHNTKHLVRPLWNTVRCLLLVYVA